MLLLHSINTTLQLMPIYYTTVHKNKTNISLNMAKNGWVILDIPQDKNISKLKNQFKFLIHVIFLGESAAGKKAFL